MKFKNHIRLKQPGAQIHILAFINIIFLLGMLFILSSSFVTPPAIAVKFPNAVTSELMKEENFVVTITGEDVIYVNGSIKTLKELQNLLTKSPDLSKRSLLIKSDRRTSFGRIIDVWDLCRNLGIENINIATHQEQ